MLVTPAELAAECASNAKTHARRARKLAKTDGVGWDEIEAELARIKRAWEQAATHYQAAGMIDEANHARRQANAC